MSLDNPSPNDLKLYILVNKTLPPIHAGIQASHSIHEIMFKNRDHKPLLDWAEHHKTLVLLGATEDEMIKMMMGFELFGKIYSSFQEPDLDNLLTAVAFEPLNEVDGKDIFGEFKLYR